MGRAPVERDQFLDLRDVACNRLRIDEVFVAKGGCHLQAFEMMVGAVALDGSDGARMAGARIKLRGLIDRQGISRVGDGRDWS